jgi:RNA polymerase sigma-70 factor (ECF subfamily)
METVLEMRATDEKYIAAKQNGEIFESVYRQYYKNVFNYVCFRINNHFDAEDLTCAVFEKAINAWAKYNPDYPIEAWLIGIAKNIVADYFRVKGRRTFVGIENLFGLTSCERQPEEIAVANDENRELVSAMAKLKERERQILAMKFATDLKNNEIARLLRISPSNVGAIVHRALKKLKSILEEGS